MTKNDENVVELNKKKLENSKKNHPEMWEAAEKQLKKHNKYIVIWEGNTTKKWEICEDAELGIVLIKANKESDIEKVRVFPINSEDEILTDVKNMIIKMENTF